MQPKVQLLHVIGEGRFGRVHKAIWRYNGQVAEIAVKRTRFSYVREKGRKLDRELERLKGLKSPFVVRFIGHRNTNLRNET